MIKRDILLNHSGIFIKIYFERNILKYEIENQIFSFFESMPAFLFKDGSV